MVYSYYFKINNFKIDHGVVCHFTRTLHLDPNESLNYVIHYYLVFRYIIYLSSLSSNFLTIPQPTRFHLPLRLPTDQNCTFYNNE